MEQVLIVNEWVKIGNPADKIKNMVESEHIGLILMPAHQEGRIEHFPFGGINDEIILSLPATLMSVK